MSMPASEAIAAAGTLAARRACARRRRAIARPGRLPLEVRALEVVDEAVALERAGVLLGERVQRQPVQRQLLLAVGAPNDAEVEVEVAGGRLGLDRRRLQRLPERRARVDAANLAALL